MAPQLNATHVRRALVLPALVALSLALSPAGAVGPGGGQRAAEESSRRPVTAPQANARAGVRKTAQRHVVVVHGLGGPFFAERMVHHLEAEGYAVHLFRHPGLGMEPIEAIASRLSRYVKQEIPSGDLQLVGFSQGVLITRQMLHSDPALRPRVRGFVAVAPPNNGSLLANAAALVPLVKTWFPGIAQMERNSSYLRQLNSRAADELKGIPTTNFWTPYDEIVVPGDSGALPKVGRSERVPVVGHVTMHGSRLILEKVARELRRNEGATQPAATRVGN